MNKHNLKLLILFAILTTSIAIISSADATTTLTKTEKIEVQAKDQAEAQKIMKDMEQKLNKQMEQQMNNAPQQIQQ